MTRKTDPKPKRTDQEEFWAGSFGDQYARRNKGENWVAANTALFAQILQRTRGVDSLIEFGANTGLNLQAIHRLLPDAALSANEINAGAAKKLRKLRGVEEVHEGSLFEFKSKKQWDLSLIKGVMIHLNPDLLPKAYEVLYKASRQYICVVEYYNPAPVTVSYRGHGDRLFKRDFAGEMLDRYPDLRLLDYGFAYRRDPNFPQDDVTWFLMEKGPKPSKRKAKS